MDSEVLRPAPSGGYPVPYPRRIIACRRY
jgi:hypothetical protein